MIRRIKVIDDPNHLKRRLVPRSNSSSLQCARHTTKKPCVVNTNPLLRNLKAPVPLLLSQIQRSSISTHIQPKGERYQQEETSVLELPLDTSSNKQVRLTQEQERAKIKKLALTLTSLRDPKVYSIFVHSDADADEKLLHNAKQVVEYFAHPTRFLPLIDSTTSNTVTNGDSRGRNRNRPRQKWPIVLSGPEFCHSLMTSVILPHFSQSKNAKPNCVNELISMSNKTIRSLGLLCKNSGFRFNDKQRGNRNQIGMGGMARIGNLAEDLLRLLLNTPLPIVLTASSRASYQQKKMLTNTYNNALNTWSVIARSEQDPMAAKDAAQSAENLLLDLAMSRGNNISKDFDDKQRQQASRLLEAIEADTISFNTTINAWANSGRYRVVHGEKKDVTTESAAERAESILAVLEDLHDSEKASGFKNAISPDRISYDTVIHAWSRAFHQDAPNRAILVLQNMLERHQTAGPQKETAFIHRSYCPFPNRITYNGVLTTLARSSYEDAVLKGEAIFEDMKRLSNEGFTDIWPDRIAYNSLLNIYSKRVSKLLQRQEVDALTEAYKLCIRMDEIIGEMFDESTEAQVMNDAKNEEMQDQKTLPDFTNHKTVMLSFIDTGKCALKLRKRKKPPIDIYDCAYRANSHLRQLNQFHISHSSKMLKVQPLEDLISLFAGTGKMERAVAVFDLASRYQAVEFNSHDYERILHILLRSENKVTRPCPQIVHKMEHFIFEHCHQNNIKVTTHMLNKLIEAHAKLAFKELSHARKADQILTNTLNKYNSSLEAIVQKDKKPILAPRPNSFMLQTVLSAYGMALKNRNLPPNDMNETLERMEDLLQLMEDSHLKWKESKSDPQISHYKAMVVPNVNAYNILLNAYAIGARHASSEEKTLALLEKADTLLRRMRTLSDTEKNITVEPDHSSYASLLNIVSQVRSPGVEDRAIELLAAAEKKASGIVLINSVLKVICRSEEHLPQALKILRQLEDGEFSNGFKVTEPDEYTYSTIMSALTKSNNATVHQVQKIFDSAEARGKIHLDRYLYFHLMSAYAQNRSSESVKNAENLLEKMIEASKQKDEKGHFHPNIDIFNCLFQACEFAPKCDDSSEYNPATIAFQRFGQIQEPNNEWNIKLSHQSYCRMFAICRKHVRNQKKRDDLVTLLFKKCCRDGFLTEISLNMFREVISEQNFEAVVETMLVEKGKPHNLTLDNFPIEHRRNDKKRRNPVREKK